MAKKKTAKRPVSWDEELRLTGEVEGTLKVSLVKEPTEGVIEAICVGIRSGLTVQSACTRVGVSREVARRWESESYEKPGTLYEEFRWQVEKARDESEIELVGAMRRLALGELEDRRTRVEGESEKTGSYWEERTEKSRPDAGALKWLLTKQHAETFGDRVEHVHRGAEKRILVTDGKGWASVEDVVVDVREVRDAGDAGVVESDGE